MRKLAFAFALLILAVPCQARVITVDDDGTADFDNIQAGINDANDGDVVYVADGTYTGSGNKGLNFGGRSIIVRSENGPNSCIIDCEGSGRGFKFNHGEDANSIVEGFTITNGNSEGGAIYCYHSSPTIKNCIIHKNRSPRDGGGIFCDNRSNVTIANCIISENHARRYGGGLRFWYNSKANITNCIIARNNANGIYTSNNSPPTLTNCTIVDNEPSGLSNCNGPITNCIIWGNIPNELSGSSEPTYSCYSSASAGEGNINTKPLFVDPAAGNYHLSTSSPCINAGDPNYVQGPNETDLDGDPRVINGRIDMGADEIDYVGPIMEISFSKFLFHVFAEDPTVKSQILSIRNKGTGTLMWQITGLCPWVIAHPTNGESISEIDEVTINVGISDLSLGRHSCELTITANEALRSPQAVAITLHVLDINAGLYVPSEYETIQTAIDDANHGDIVIVEPNTYTGPGNRDIDFLGKAITVRSIDANDQDTIDATIIDAKATFSNKHRAFNFHNSEDVNSILEGFTITNCYMRNGAVISCYNSSPTISKCVIIGNDEEEVHLNGIIRLSNSMAIIEHCTISNNKAGNGGGIYLKNSSPTIAYCNISNNRAYTNGGGIYCAQSNPTIVNCDILNNSARLHGGGVYCTEGSKPSVNNCSLIGNSCSGGDGGGMCCWRGKPKITNCIMSDNTGKRGDGGAIYLYKSDAIICTSTITKNLAYWGGAIRSENSNPTLINCILWGNKGSHGHNEIYGGAMVSYSDVKGGFSGFCNIDADPCFVNLAGGDYNLLSSSPCIDTGDPNFVPEPNETDLDGKPRVVDGDNDGNSVVDMGAYEWMPLTPAELIAQLLEEVGGLGLPGGIENSLMAKLNAALRALEDENENNDAAAVNSLEAFINAVEAQRGKKIPEVEADALIAAAEEIIELLSGG